MLGKPKYKLGSIVEFRVANKDEIAYICMIDAFGTFEQNDEVSYDLKSADMLYKHITETDIVRYVNDDEIIMVPGRKLHVCHLYNDPFMKIKYGKKRIEYRLYDEKRRKMSVGDIIVFMESESSEKLVVIIENIFRANSFEGLKTVLFDSGLVKESEEFIPEKMREYYDKDDEIKNGVVGIQIHVLSKST